MPQWLIDLLNNPVAVTAIGAGLAVPLLDFLAKLVMRRAPPPPPTAYDVRDLPEHPLLVSTKVRLDDEERKLLTDTQAMVAEVRTLVEKEVMPCLRHLDRRHDKFEGRIEKVDGQIELINDRLDILFRGQRSGL